MITLELIKSIMAGQDEKSVEYIYQSLKAVEDISLKIKSLDREICAENVRYEQKIKDIKATISEIQSKCPHWTTNYYPDPSGNNDSYTVCKICNKTL